MKIRTSPIKWGDLTDGIEINIPEDKPLPSPISGLKNKYNRKVTIYNDIPSDGVNPRRFDRYVIDKCNVQSGYVERADGTVQNIVNAITVITRDVQHYKSPAQYAQLPEDERGDFFTVQVDDFVVLDEVDDVVTTSRQYQELQQKYAKSGFLVTASNPSIYGMALDNVSMTNA